MATNFKEHFDRAILRPGRFDALICMGPPTLSSKILWIKSELAKQEATAPHPSSVSLVSAITSNDEVREIVSVWTYGDMKGFLEHFSTALPGDVVAAIRAWGQTAAMRWDEIAAYPNASRALPEKIEDLDKTYKQSAMLRYWAEYATSKIQ